MDQLAKFYEELGHQIKQYPAGIDALAEASGVSKVTLWRWGNGINLKYPDHHRVLQVLMVISNQNSLTGVKSFFGGALSEYLKTTPSSNYLKITQEKEINLLQDYYFFLIYLFTGNESGASVEELIETCGNIAAKKAGFEDLSLEAILELGKLVLPKIKELENRELIIYKEGRYFRNQNAVYIPLDENQIVNYFCQNLENFVKPKDFPFGFNAFYTVVESIKPEVAKELALDTRNFFEECLRKMENGKCKNGIPYQLILSAERMEFFPDYQIEENN